MHTTEEVENYVEEHKDRLEEFLKNCGMISFIPIDVLRPVLQAGAWLGPTLAKDGATDE